MNLVELRLLAFGPFTGLTLDFSAAPGLHLIYGSNEAGKSTTLRAISGLLYGIPATTLDAHTHRMSELRIGARLSDGNGTTLDVVRRKGNKNTLLDPEDNPIDEGVLRRLLGGVSEALFRTMFGLDHESLRAGGEALLNGQGDVGESLFDAGVGGPGIHRVLEDLRAEADAIFRPQGQNPRLNQAIALYKDAEKRSRESAVPAEAWFTQQGEIESASRERGELQARRRNLAAEQSRLQRALRVLPLLGKRRQILARREAMGEVVALPADAGARRDAAQRQSDSCALQIARLEVSIRDLRTKRDGLGVPEALATLGDDVVADLQKRLGAHRSAAGDLPRRRAELQALESDIGRLLRDLGREEGVDDVARLRLPAAAQSRLRSLGKRQSGLEKDLEHADAALAERRSRLERLRGQIGNRDGDAGEASALPSLDSIDRFAAELQGLEREEGELRAGEREQHQRLSKVAAAIEELRLLGEVPTEEQLVAARRQRDRLWDELAAQLDQPRRARAAAESFAAALHAADDIVDRLRREAERTGRLANLLASQREAEEQQRWLAGERAALAARREAHAAAWSGLWNDAGVRAQSPAEMRTWLLERRRLEEAAAELGREVALLEETRARAEAQLATWRSQWTASVAVIGLDENAAVEEAEDVLATLTTLLAKADEAGRLRARIAGMERDADKLRGDVDALVARHAPDLRGDGFEEAAERLLRRHLEARDAARRRADLDDESAAKEKELAELVGERQRAEDTLRVLQHAAGASTLGELEEAERRSAEAAQLDGELRQVDGDILEAGDGANLEALAELVGDIDPDSARVRLADIETEIDDVGNEISRLDQKIGGCEQGLKHLEGRTAAVEAAADAQEHAATIRAQVQRYLRTRLAVLVLEEEIERYRQQNQGPVLQRANELFPRLTLGRYRGLKVGFDARDEGVLLCVRADGTEVGVEGLSDGTRDQLYLALRLASLERYLRQNPGMPVILDDILIHFDDDRARAALAVIGELAEKAQVLFFTHHARLVELAREAIAGLIEHRLGAGEEALTADGGQRTE